ncbi:hypothetical protein Lal_00022355 [Lupinus albus]|nr:hypothetical protein Lal_00022355 [Lupinus albus]
MYEVTNSINNKRIRSAYSILNQHGQHPNINTHHSNLIWKSKAPLKVISFAWRLFQNRIPTKDALLKRGVPLTNGGGLSCAFCNDHPESTNHLFSSCNLSYSVWQLIYKWLNISIVLPLNPSDHFTHHLGLVKNRKCWKTWSVILIATIWALWLARNDLIFNNINPSINKILDSAKVKSWLWIKTQLGMTFLLYDDWLSNPLLCINIVV